MAAFMVTLAPAAVFAAPGDVDAQASEITIDGHKADGKKVDVQDKVKVQIDLLDTNGKPMAKQLNPADSKLYVWAEKVNGEADSALKVYAANGNHADGDANNVHEVAIPVLSGGASYDRIEKEFTFSREGNYTIKAALYNGKVNNDSKPATVKNFRDANVLLKTVETKVIVSGVSKDANKADIKVSTDKKPEFKELNDKTEPVVVKANGVDPVTVTLRVKAENGEVLGSGKEVALDTNSGNVTLNKKSAKTNNRGEVEFKVTGTIAGDYKVYATVDTQDFVIPVKVVEQDALEIKLVKQDNAPLAKNDPDFDGIRFEITDLNGNIVYNAKQIITGEDVAGKDKENYVKLLDSPSAFKGEAEDFSLVQAKDSDKNNKDYYTIAIKDKSKLAEGKYTIQFFLDNGRSAKASFEVKKFDTPVSLHVDYDTDAVDLGATTKAPDIYYLDKNGVKKTAKDVTLGYNGYAVDSNSNSKFNTETGVFRVKNDEAYLGSKIVVLAVSERYNLTGKAELTVAKDGRTLKFAETSGVVNSNNKVMFQLVDGDGKDIKPMAKITGVSATVVSKSNEEARVSATPVNANNSDLRDKGEGYVTVTADKATTAEIQVVVTDEIGRYYAGTLKYSFGLNGKYAGRTVVMTIGSKEVIVDNNVVMMDTAAIVTKDFRTFVPFRALAESFGAKVDYKDSVVTAELNGVKVEMKIGEKTYKVGDKEKTMDVAPFVQNDRTMIPVRFAAQAFGFKVLPTYNANGTTASVGFYM